MASPPTLPDTSAPQIHAPDDPDAALEHNDRLEAIYAANRQGLYSLALTVCGDPERAEDAIQEAFARLFTGRGRNARDLTAYAFAAVRNAAYDQLRRRRHERNEPVSVFATTAVAPAGGLMDDTDDHALLKRAVDELPDAEREVVVLHIYAGLGFTRIADSLDAPVSTVHSRYRRALERLRAQMAEVMLT
ncbi:MAG: RNA polymerase sigma factor [Planctomycetota bacterium]